MELGGVHFLLTYRCTQECDHCFVYGSPRADATFTGDRLTRVLEQCAAVGTVEWVFFEGGEPFLYYPILWRGVVHAARLGFSVGLVTNAYWATSAQDALRWLEGLGSVQLLHVSSDDLHHGGDSKALARVEYAVAAAERLDIAVSTLRVEPGDIMFRGRAADKLTPGLTRRPAATFDSCPHEKLDAPTRLHVDPLGFVQVCQGITIGNVFETPLREIVKRYQPASHPIVGPLLRGGPCALARALEVDPDANGAGGYVDACHLCFLARRQARARGLAHLEPAIVYEGS
ncbi:MAG: radical SAM protein [Planctomycetota bacterium]|jgi:MoaA/NifB/PqqE/SkfB family radical SAM enzyme